MRVGVRIHGRPRMDRHGAFLTMARAGAIFPNQTWLIELLGQAYEDASVELGKQNPTQGGLGSSANTPEDAISNKLGASFGASLDANVPLSKQLADFFTSVNAKKGNEAWNFVLLPPNEIVWERCWRADPDKAMRRIRMIMDKNHRFWKDHKPTDAEIMDRIKRGEAWGPIAFPEAYERR